MKIKNDNNNKFMLLLFFVVSCTNINTEATIYGNWKGKYNDHELSFVFKSDNTCVLNYFDIQSNKLETIDGNYELDFSKKPIPLSIRNIPQLNHSLHTIIEFVGIDSMIMAEFSPKSRLRPITFINGNILNLNRIKKLN